MAEYNSVNLGRIMPKYTGDYSTNVNYNTLDIVFYEGSSYIATQPSLRQTPAIDSEYWGLISGKGAKGDKGDKGDKGAKGDKGDTGPQGQQGKQGIQGQKGDKGDTGPQGPAGKDADIPVIGGRNYVLDSNVSLKEEDTSIIFSQSTTPDFYSGKKITASVTIKYKNIKSLSATGFHRLVFAVQFRDDAGNIKLLDTQRVVSVIGDSFNRRISNTIDLSGVSVTSVPLIGLYIQGINADYMEISNPKLEAGNVPTDWTPAPEDVPSGLSIGGRNLLLNSAFLKGFDNSWGNENNSWTIDSSTYQGSPVIKSPTTIGSGSRLVQRFTNPPTSGSKVTVSFNARGNDSNSIILVTLFNTNAVSIPLSSSFSRYTVSFTIPSNFGVPQIYFWNAIDGNNVFLNSIKVEVGNIATDWTPAPEDIDSAIAKAPKLNGNNMYVGDNTYMGTNTFMDGVSLNGKNVVNGLTDTDWLDIPLAEGRTGTAKYKVSMGRVAIHLEGVKGITAVGNNAQGKLFTLPVYQSPYAKRYILHVFNSKLFFRQVTIMQSGDVYVSNDMGTPMSGDDSYLFDTVLI